MEYNVLLVESNRLMIEQLANVINATEGFSVAAKYQEPADALGQGAVFNPNLIMLDVESNPVSILEDFKRIYPDTSIMPTCSPLFRAKLMAKLAISVVLPLLPLGEKNDTTFDATSMPLLPKVFNAFSNSSLVNGFIK